MKKTIKFSKFILCTILTLCLSLSVFASSNDVESLLKDFDMDLTIPSDALVIPADTASDDYLWRASNVLDVNDSIESMDKLDASFMVTKKDSMTDIYVSKKQTVDSETIFNLSSLSSEEMDEMLLNYTINDSNTVCVTDTFMVGEIPFIEVDYRYSDENGKKKYEYIIFTIVNGYTVSFNINFPVQIEAESKNYMKDLASTAVFGDIKEKPKSEDDAENIIRSNFLGIKFEKPENCTIFEDASKITLADLESLKVEDSATVLDAIESIKPQICIISNDGKSIIYMTKAQSKVSKQYYDFNELNQEELDVFLKTYVVDDGTTLSKAEFYNTDNAIFVENDISITTDELKIYEYNFFTLQKGFAVAISQNGFTKLSDESIAISRHIVDTAELIGIDYLGGLFPSVSVYEDLKLNNTAEENTNRVLSLEEYVLYLVSFIALILLLVGCILYVVFSYRKRQKQDKILLAQLTTYRQYREENFDASQEVLFKNTLEVTDPEIDKFTAHLCYKHKPLSYISTILISLLGIGFAFISQTDWWLYLIFAGCFIYGIYKFAVAAPTLSKSLKKIYANNRTRIAYYKFYESEFQVRGIESNEYHPYFQISDVAINGDRMYLFLGESNPYLLDLSLFDEAELEKFKKFIAKKSKRKIK